MNELKGSATGASRKNITDRAFAEAKKYFDTECVSITLHHEHAETEYVHNNMFEPPVPAGTTFTADYTAAIEHKWSAPRAVIHECINCGITTYNR